MRETYKIILVALIILILSQAFMIGLASNSFEKIHVASELIALRGSGAVEGFQTQDRGRVAFWQAIGQAAGHGSFA